MKKLLPLLIALIFFMACTDDYIPKPVGLFRIDIPEHGYVKLDNPSIPYQFEYADYARIVRRFDKDSNWVNIDYLPYKGSLFLTYHHMDTTLAAYIEDCHSMAYKHTPKATNIETKRIIIDSNNVYGLVYYISGSEAASPLNFYLTDSSQHFIRGALYFNIMPNNDSLRTVIQSIEKDVDHLIGSFRFRP
jgi:gliding motility-associated lipoprotein GldD